MDIGQFIYFYAPPGSELEAIIYFNISIMLLMTLLVVGVIVVCFITRIRTRICWENIKNVNEMEEDTKDYKMKDMINYKVEVWGKKGNLIKRGVLVGIVDNQLLIDKYKSGLIDEIIPLSKVGSIVIY